MSFITQRRAESLCYEHGYHGRRAEAVKLYRAGRVPFRRYFEAYAMGEAARKAGNRCPCQDCSK